MITNLHINFETSEAISRNYFKALRIVGSTMHSLTVPIEGNFSLCWSETSRHYFFTADKSSEGNITIPFQDLIRKYDTYNNADLMKRGPNKHPLINPDSAHYQMFDGTETIESMEKLMSTEELMGFARGCAYKYRLRIGSKKQVDATSDLAKIATYEAYYRYLKELHNE